jgi:hypothetical protein
MKEHPILFKGQMIRQIKGGRPRKTNTRRPIKYKDFDGKKKFLPARATYIGKDPETGLFIFDIPGYSEYIYIRCPYGEVGDHLWVREAVVVHVGGQFRYSADAEWGKIPAEGREWYLKRIGKGLKSVPSIYVPRWASRITLENKVVEPVRLQDLTYAGARREGFKSIPDLRELWSEMYDDEPEMRWHSNPLVWLIGFKKIKG